MVRLAPFVVLVASGGCDLDRAGDADVEREGTCTVAEHCDGSKIITCASHTGLAPFSGTVANAVTGSMIAGAQIIFDPPVVELSTSSNGIFAGTVLPGTYWLTFAAEHFTTLTDTLTLTHDAHVTKDVRLLPSSEVIVTASTSAERSDPNSEVMLHASTENLGASTIAGILWQQTHGPPALLTDPNHAMTRVIFADPEAYEEARISRLAESGGVAQHVFQVSVWMADGQVYRDWVYVEVDLPAPTP